MSARRWWGPKGPRKNNFARRGWPVGAPGRDPALAEFFQTPAAVLYPKLPFDISPVTDNRLFFFYTARGDDFIGRALAAKGAREAKAELEAEEPRGRR